MSDDLVNIIQEGWWGALITSSPFSDIKLGIYCMIDQGGF